MSMKTVASISSWCVQLKSDASLNLAFNFLWKSFWKIISCTTCDSEVCSDFFRSSSLNDCWIYAILYPLLNSLVHQEIFPTIDLNAWLQIGAEIHLAAYEALAPVLKAVISVFSPLALDLIGENDKSMLQKAEGKPLLDSLVLTFLQDINSLLGFGALARTRRAILMNWKVIGLCFFVLLFLVLLDSPNSIYFITCNIWKLAYMVVK